MSKLILKEEELVDPALDLDYGGMFLVQAMDRVQRHCLPFYIRADEKVERTKGLGMLRRRGDDCHESKNVAIRRQKSDRILLPDWRSKRANRDCEGLRNDKIFLVTRLNQTITKLSEHCGMLLFWKKTL